MEEALFVYGTLQPGRSNEAVLSAVGGSFQTATIRGTLYRYGWLREFPYPGVELDPEGGVITGHIFTSPNLYLHWARLDAFEGDNYKRVKTVAKTSNGNECNVFVYVINPLTKKLSI